MLDRFLPELWPFVSFSYFINRSSCLHNSSYSFKGILIKLSNYCSHDLKMIMFYRGHALLIYQRRGSYYNEVTLDRFLPELWPFVSFSHFINRSSCLRNSSYSLQGILMKLSSYCSNDLKMIIFYRGHAQLIFIRVMAL